MRIFILCGGYYTNFDYPKSLTVIKGETLLDRTLRLLSSYDCESVVCCNLEETAFDNYNHFKAHFTFDYVKQTGYYLDCFDALPYEKCIILFGDVYYTEDAINKIITKYNETERNIFICNHLPWNEQHIRQGEPFGWIVKDEKEFELAVKLCKRLQDRNIIDHANGIPSNWELAHLINGLGVNDFCLKKEDCLIIDDLTIDIDDPKMIERLESKL